jgi:hypothetical protein
MNMLFFRSEEMLSQWLATQRAERGAVLSVPEVWGLSQLWYRDRMSLEYHGRTIEQVQQIFQQRGLTSEFWQAASAS